MLESLETVLEISNLLVKVKDVDLLLEKILLQARKITKADAGSIYRVEDGKLRLKYAQNDTKQKELAPGKKLIFKSFLLPINNETIAGYVANTGESVNIADAYTLPEGLPYNFNSEYDKLSDYKTHSVLTIPLKDFDDQVVGVLQLINAKDDNGDVIPFSDDYIPIITIIANSAALALEKAELFRMLVLRMISLAELRDPKETGTHVNRVGAYSAELYEVWAKERGVDEGDIERNKDALRIAAMLHDVGKVAISDKILKKEGPLTDDEFEIIKQHTYKGAALFYPSKFLLEEMAYKIALEHHERWDGTGYPGHIDVVTGKPLPGFELSENRARGKKGEEISIWGRIVTLADVYDALSSTRCYKASWPKEKIFEEFKRQAGRQFDPELVDVFLKYKDQILHAAQDYQEESGSSC